MLRAGDAVYADGVEMVVRGDCETLTHPPGPVAVDADNPQVLLRGVGGQHHGRSFTLDSPRLVGRGREADIEIDNPAFAAGHARIECHGDKVLLRDLGSADGSVVNGNPVRHCWLQPGDQVVFDGHHRFVLEVPLLPRPPACEGKASNDDDAGAAEAMPVAAATRRSRRWPWLLLSAVLLGVLISALLLFGAR